MRTDQVIARVHLARSRPAARGVVLFVGIAFLAVALLAGCSNDSTALARLGVLDDSTLGMRTNGGFFDLEEFERTEQLLGLPILYTVQFTGRNSPQQMNSSARGLLGVDSATLDQVAGRVTLVLAVPLAFADSGESDVELSGQEGLIATAAGRHDVAFVRVARRLVDAGHGNAIIRLGHEFNGNWPPWSAVGHEEDYIAAWRHVHDVMLSEAPDLRFDWTGMRADWAETAPPAWPGDEYVDYVGMDLYWRSDDGEWDAGRWERQFLPNLEAQFQFAQEHGKPVSYPEWGIESGDVPEFIEEMHRWFRSLPPAGRPGSLGYHAYFDGGGEYALELYPEAEQRFVELFGRSGRHES